MPSQTYADGAFVMNESHRKSSDNLAKALGLQLVGVLIINERKQPPIHPLVLLTLGKMAEEIGEFFTVICALPDAGVCHFEAFQLSKQFLDQAKAGLFVGAASNDQLKTKEAIWLYTKSATEFDVSYFLVNVAIKARDSWFPRAGFPYQCLYPTTADFMLALNADFDVPDFVRFLDFSLLLFLEQWFTPGNEIPMIARTCIAKKELPVALSGKLHEIAQSAAMLPE
jgi:hypothetical protein